MLFFPNAHVLNYIWKLFLCVSIVHINISEAKFSEYEMEILSTKFLLLVLIVIVKNITHS